jgi:hypothetical protein
MKQKFQVWSLPLGLAAYGSALSIMSTNVSHIHFNFALIFSGLLTLGAGYVRANATLFFTGATLALCCWAAYGATGATERERSYIGIAMLIMFAVTLVSGAIVFFAGYLARGMAKALRARHVIE